MIDLGFSGWLLLGYALVASALLIYLSVKYPKSSHACDIVWDEAVKTETVQHKAPIGEGSDGPPFQIHYQYGKCTVCKKPCKRRVWL